MTVANRYDARMGLYETLSQAGAVPSVQAIYSYQPHTFNKQSPIIFLTSSGSMRDKLTTQGYKSLLIVNAHIIVFYGSNDVGYSEEDAEQIIDQVESEVANAILNPAISAKNRGILQMGYIERSNADDPINDGGEIYLHEIIPIGMRFGT